MTPRAPGRTFDPQPGTIGEGEEAELAVAHQLRGYFISLNKAWEDVLGWTREELCSRPYIAFVHGDDVERTARQAARVVQPDYEIVDFENRFRHKDGTYRGCAGAPARMASSSSPSPSTSPSESGARAVCAGSATRRSYPTSARPSAQLPTARGC